MFKKNKECRLRDLLKNSQSYYTRQFVRTGATDERIRVATWLQDYDIWRNNNGKNWGQIIRFRK